ncbi:hypothetical protein ACQKOM_10565 [Peribacillus frigoritolerans]|uniref:hypothetical protein n=1 Tax=Peribacillus frigoritolerans TaxID=450367 RepID=UPI003D006C22
MINREVGKQGKGFRLQRLRAIKLLLDKMKTHETAIICAATEYIDDVYIKTVDDYFTEEIAEGDKNYDPNKTFSFMSYEVRNSLVSFIDCFFKFRSEGLFYCFYTNVDIAKEYNTKKVKASGWKLPDKSIISLLMERKYEYPNLLETIKKVIIEEYKSQYEAKEEKGFLDSILKMTDSIWIEFLDRIDWEFNQEDEKELEITVLKDIGMQSFYKIDVDGKELSIMGRLLDELEKRQNTSDLYSRLLSNDYVKTIFLEVASDQSRIGDPVYKQWENLEPPTDNRNIEEKIYSVCDGYSPKKIMRLARKVGAVKIEFDTADYKARAAYQYRIFEACDEYLSNSIHIYKGEITSEVLDKWIEDLVNCAREHLDDKSQDFIYPFKSKDTLKSTILELFDSCYLAFEGEGD